MHVAHFFAMDSTVSCVVCVCVCVCARVHVCSEVVNFVVCEVCGVRPK